MKRAARISMLSLGSVGLLLSLLVANPVATRGAWAQANDKQPNGQVCVLKRDRTGGKLGFIVLRKAAARFEAAGFSVVPCPDAAKSAPRRVPFVCEHLRGLGERSREVVLDLYELSVDDMCSEVDAWAATPAPEK